MRLERRAFDLTEIRAEDDGDDRTIVGHAAVFEQLSEPIFGFRERIRKGAFRKTIRESDVRALFNHDTNFVIGRTKSGTLKLREDGVGLRFEATAPDTTWARDLITSIDRGDIDQASFGFRAIKDEFATESGQTVRELIEVQLFDVSPVTFPAYPQTDVQARDLLASSGIDLDAVASVLARKDRGMELEEGEIATVKRTIDVLNRYVEGEEEEPGQGPHSEDGRTPLTVLKRRLELAELEVV